MYVRTGNTSHIFGQIIWRIHLIYNFSFIIQVLVNFSVKINGIYQTINLHKQINLHL